LYFSLSPAPHEEEDEEGYEEAEEEPVAQEEPASGSRILNWASWAVGLVPNALFGGSEEDPEPDDDTESGNASASEIPSSLGYNESRDPPILHIAVRINMVRVTLKGYEGVPEKPNFNLNPTPRLRNSPYLRLKFQGILAEFVLRTRDTHSSFGVSEVSYLL